MKRLLILTALASLYAMLGRIRSAATAALAQLYAASLPVPLDPAATSPDSPWHQICLRYGRGSVRGLDSSAAAGIAGGIAGNVGGHEAVYRGPCTALPRFRMARTMATGLIGG
jgi:hypothetical protein